jgi:hypothetical protein
MPEYVLTITVKDVAENDAAELAQRIWETHAADLDATLGDFDIEVSRREGGSLFGLGWIAAE